MLYSKLSKTKKFYFNRVLYSGKNALHKTTKRTPNFQETQSCNTKNAADSKTKGNLI